MTNLGMGEPLMRIYANKQMERFQYCFAEAAPVSEKSPRMKK